jgi:hypothetical protein
LKSSYKIHAVSFIVNKSGREILVTLKSALKI